MGGERTIIFEHAASDQLEEAYKKYPRAEDWWVHGWCWRLAHDPYLDAIVVPGSADPPVYFLKTEQYAEYGAPPSTVILYVVEDKSPEDMCVRILQFHFP